MATIEDVQKDIADVRAFVKAKSRAWIIAAIIAAIIIALLLVVIFKKSNNSDGAKLQQLDSIVHYQQTTINALQQLNNERDSSIKKLQDDYKANRPAETRIIHKYEQIPVDVNAMDRDRLRREVTNF